MKDYLDELMETLSEEEKIEVDSIVKEETLKIELRKVRERFKKNQTDVKGFSQVSISQIENRKDIKISTLIKYLQGLGLHMRITTYGDKEEEAVTLINV